MRRGSVWNVAGGRVIVAAVIAAMAGGCSSTPQTAVNPTPAGTPASVESTTTAAPPVSPTPTPPEAPTAMENDDQAGAKAAIQHFFDLRTYAFETGDTRPLTKMSSDKCKFCSSSLDRARDLSSRDETSNGPRVIVEQAEFVGIQEDRNLDFEILATQGPWQVTDVSGVVLSSNDKARTIEALVGVYRQGGSWRIRAVNITDDGS